MNTASTCPRRTRLISVLFAALAAVALSCGGSKDPSPAGPTPLTQEPQEPSSQDAWAIDGTVVTTIGRVPIAGASVKPQFGEAVRTDPQGRFRLAGTSNPGLSTFSVVVTATGHVEREVWMTWRRGTRALTLDVVAETSPFVLSFYRQIARDAYEEPDFSDLLVWSAAPAFYVRTVDDRGNSVEQTVIRTISDTVRSAVRDFTGGRFAAVNVVTGAAARAPRRGWINVNIVDDLEDGACGSAYVGTDPGEIGLLRAGCGCSNRRISSAIVTHEVGHALGFFHVGERSSVMYPFVAGRCPSATPTESDRHHTAIAYSRPPGNADPDRDPQTSRLVNRRIRIVN